MFCLECELVVKHFLANFLYILLYLGCDTDILLIHYNAEWHGKKSARVYTLSSVLWFDTTATIEHKECPPPQMPYSYFYYRSSSYHVSVVNGFSQSIYYSLTLISRHLSMTNTKLFLGRPGLLFCLIICIRDVLFYIHYDRSDSMACNYVTLLDITFCNSNVISLKIR